MVACRNEMVEGVGFRAQGLGAAHCNRDPLRVQQTSCVRRSPNSAA